MGIFDIFTPHPANPNPAPAPAANPAPAQPNPAAPVEPGNIPPTAGVTDPNNPTLPPGTPEPTPAEPITPELPLDQFKDLWDDVPVDPNAPKPEAPVELKAEDIQKAVANANFTQAITPEQLTAITAGGEEATKAFGEALNLVAKQVMVQATLVGNKLTENAVAKAIEDERGKIPQMLRDQASQANLTDTNPIFDNPAVKPIIELTRAQLLAKNPAATPDQITKMTNDYILAMGEAFAPAKPDLAPGETDWTKFLA